MKKIITYLIMLISVTYYTTPVFAEEYTPSGNVIHGYIETTDNMEPQKGYFTGEKEVVKKGETVEMTVSEVISSGYTQQGDEFFAEISGEVKGENGGIVLPIGTLAHGHVKQMVEAKRLGRDGWIDLHFDSLITPDGRQIPIEAHITTRQNPVKGTAIKVVQDAGYTAVGGIIGGFTALNLLGLEAAIASQGYTVAGGAAIGGAVGLGMSLYRKGKDVLITPGDELKVKILNGVDLPVINEEHLKQHELFYDGLDVQLNEIAVVKDPFGEKNTISVDMTVYNSSEKDFSTLDIGLINELDKRFYPSIFSDKNYEIKQIKSGETSNGKLFFAVDNPAKPHWLVFYDKRTQKPLTKISLNNALKALEKEKQERKKHKKTRKS